VNEGNSVSRKLPDNVARDVDVVLDPLGGETQESAIMWRRHLPAPLIAISSTEMLKKSFGLPAILRAVTAAAKDKDHRILALQFGELPVFAGVIGKFVIGELTSWNNVRSHMNFLG
jgi:hypothetical protein